jgi:hypothetical protein
MKTILAMLLCSVLLFACAQNKKNELFQTKPIANHNFVEFGEPGHFYFKNFKILPLEDGQLLGCTSVRFRNDQSQDPSLELIKLDANLKINSHMKIPQPYDVLEMKYNKEDLILATENYETHQPAILHLSQNGEWGAQLVLPIGITSKCISKLDKNELMLFDKITDRYAHEIIAMHSYDLDGKLKREVIIPDEMYRDVLTPHWFSPTGSFIDNRQGITLAVVDTLTRKQYVKRISMDGTSSISSTGFDFPISAISLYQDTIYVCGIHSETNQMRIVALDSSLNETHQIKFDKLKQSPWIKGMIRLPNGFAILNDYFTSNDKETATDIQVLFINLKGKLISSEEIGFFSNYMGWTFGLLSTDKVGVFGLTAGDVKKKTNHMIYGTVDIPKQVR